MNDPPTTSSLMSVSTRSPPLVEGGSIRHVGSEFPHWDNLQRPWAAIRSATAKQLHGLPAFVKRDRPTTDHLFEIQYTSASDRRHTSTEDYHSGYDVYLRAGAPVAELLLPLGRDLGGVVKVFDLQVSPDTRLGPVDYRDYHSQFATICDRVAKSEGTLRGDDAIVLDFRNDYRGGGTEEIRADQLVEEWGQLASSMPRVVAAIPAASSDWQVGIYRRSAGAEYKYVLVVKFYDVYSFKNITQSASRQAAPGVGPSNTNLDELVGDFTRAEVAAGEQCDRVANRFLDRVKLELGERYASVKLSGKNVVHQPTNTMRKIPTVRGGFTHVLHVGTSPTAPPSSPVRRSSDTVLYKVPVMLGKAQGVALVEYTGRDIQWPRTVPQNAPRAPEARDHTVEDDNVTAHRSGHLGLGHWVGARCPVTIQPTTDGEDSVWDDIYGRQTKNSSSTVTSAVFEPLGQIGATSTVMHLRYSQQLKRLGLGVNRFTEENWYASNWTAGPVPADSTAENTRGVIRSAFSAEGKVRCEGAYRQKSASALVQRIVTAFFTAGEGSTISEYANGQVVDGVNGGFDMSSIFDIIAYSTQYYARHARQRHPLVAPADVMVEIRDDWMFANLALTTSEMEELRKHFDTECPPSPLPRVLHALERYNYM